MNLVDKQTHTLLKYGTLSPTIWQRMGLQKSIPFYEVLKSNNGDGNAIWTKAFAYSQANKKDLITEGYNKNISVYSIISKIARIAAQAPWAIYTVKSQKDFERYKSLQQQPYSQEQHFELKKARIKALEINEKHFLSSVFQSPNEQQSGAEYHENLCGMKLLTGDAYEFGNMLKSGMPGELWVLPSQFVEIKNNGSFPMRETGYVLSFGGGNIDIDKKSVMHSKYWNPNWNVNGNHLYGFSPLEAAWLSNLSDNNAREALVEQLQNRGVRGVLFWQHEKIVEQEVAQYVSDQLKEKWSQANKEYRDKIFPFMGKGDYVSVGLPIKDMMALEVCNMSLKDLCNAYGVSDLLFNNQVASTKDNLLIARKDMITGAVLPLLTSIRDGRNRKLKNGDWNPKKENIVVDFDPTIYTELEADKKDTVEWMKKAGTFTDNEIRQQLNFEPADYLYANEPWKSTNELPVSQIKQQPISK